MNGRAFGRSVLAAAAILVAADASAQRSVVLVRHAERLDTSSDSPLSPAGVERAKRLAAMVKDTGIAAIYSTDFQRTRKTAEPLAAALGLTVNLYDSKEDRQLVARLREKHPNDIVLVVGHSNTIPLVLQAFGHPDKVSIADDEYTNLFVVTPREGKAPVVVRLRY